jgi:multidrug resistance protein, MATE family
MVATEETGLLSKTESGRTEDTTLDSNPQFKNKHPSLRKDIHDTIWLAGPIFMAMLSWVGMKTTDTALLGHVSGDALAAAALSDLWTMCTGILVQGGILSVLCGSAVGAGNPKLAGIYLQVSYFVLAGLGVLVMISWWFTEKVWLAFGSDPEIAHMAGFYAQVLAWSIPGQLIFSQLSQFFQAQRIMHPEVNSSMVALFLNLTLGLVFVLGIPIPNFEGYGFPACPTVTTAVVYIQVLFFYTVYIHNQKLHEECWGGWSYKEITWERIKTFSDLVRAVFDELHCIHYGSGL